MPSIIHAEYSLLAYYGDASSDEDGSDSDDDDDSDCNSVADPGTARSLSGTKRPAEALDDPRASRRRR